MWKRTLNWTLPPARVRMRRKCVIPAGPSYPSLRHSCAVLSHRYQAMLPPRTLMTTMLLLPLWLKPSPHSLPALTGSLGAAWVQPAAAPSSPWMRR